MKNINSSTQIEYTKINYGLDVYSEMDFLYKLLIARHGHVYYFKNPESNPNKGCYIIKISIIASVYTEFRYIEYLIEVLNKNYKNNSFIGHDNYTIYPLQIVDKNITNDFYPTTPGCLEIHIFDVYSDDFYKNQRNKFFITEFFYRTDFDMVFCKSGIFINL